MCLCERAQLIVAHTNVMRFCEAISLELSSLQLLTSPTEPGYLDSSIGMGETGLAKSMVSVFLLHPLFVIFEWSVQFIVSNQKKTGAFSKKFLHLVPSTDMTHIAVSQLGGIPISVSLLQDQQIPHPIYHVEFIQYKMEK